MRTEAASGTRSEFEVFGAGLFVHDEPVICAEDEEGKLRIEGDDGDYNGSFKFQSNFCPHCGFKAEVKVKAAA